MTIEEAYYEIIDSIIKTLSLAGRGCAKTNLLTIKGIWTADVPDAYKKAFADAYFGYEEEDET